MMKIKRKMPKLASVLLCFSMVSMNLLSAYATEAVVTETSLEEAGENGNNEPENDTVNTVMLNDDVEPQADSNSRYEEIEVNYSQSSTYFVTIPKTITLGADKKAAYSVKVEGDIVANKQVCVVPVDGIEDTEVFDFYMADQIAGSTKEDVVAEVSQAKFYWNHEETAAGYEETDNYVIADSLSAGKWKGTFQMEISMRTDPAHIHNYVGEVTKEPTCTEKGEKTYTCDCGDSYTEEIPAKGHHFENGECTDCGEKDPDHEHSYTETITKEPTCTEAGEKTYTCNCGDSYTEEIPAKGHHFEDGECTDCGEKDPDYHKHSYTETITKEPTCTEAGEKTYTCDCGDSYTEEIPAKGHHYGDDDKCTECGDKHTHNYVDGVCTGCGKVARYVTDSSGTYSDWDYTLDDANNIITLNYYKGSASNVVVYANYVVDGVKYKTQLKSNNSNAASYYMFAASGTKTDPAKTMTSIVFSDVLDTSNVTNMKAMFYHCNYLTSIDFGDSFDTSNVTNMSYMFGVCKSLTNLDLSRFNTSKVTDMNNMFYMFNSNSALSRIDFGDNFDTSNVTNMYRMFYNCTSLTSLDLSCFNTDRVTNMQEMFAMYNSNSLLTSVDLSSFNTSNVTNMSYMFNNAQNLKTIYATEGKWIITQANRTSMFNKCGTSSVTYK